MIFFIIIKKIKNIYIFFSIKIFAHINFIIIKNNKNIYDEIELKKFNFNVNVFIIFT
jgi:ribosomal protein L33